MKQSTAEALARLLDATGADYQFHPSYRYGEDGGGTTFAVSAPIAKLFLVVAMLSRNRAIEQADACAAQEWATSARQQAIDQREASAHAAMTDLFDDLHAIRVATVRDQIVIY